MKKFPHKRMLITGGGSGLGQVIALEFASRAWGELLQTLKTFC